MLSNLSARYVSGSREYNSLDNRISITELKCIRIKGEVPERVEHLKGWNTQKLELHCSKDNQYQACSCKKEYIAKWCAAWQYCCL